MKKEGEELKSEELEVKDEFGDFFDAAIKGEVKVEPEKVELEKVEPEKVEPEKVEPEKVEPEKVEPKEDPRVRKLEREIEELKTAVAKPREEVKKEGPSEAEILAAQEDTKHMAAFAKDWPDHAKAMEIMQRGVVGEVQKAVEGLLKPLFEKIPGLEKAITEVSGDKAQAVVAAVHPDWKQMVPEIENWIPTLPKYLQRAANETLDGGSPEDMIELLSDYKAAVGITKEEQKEEKKVEPEVNKERLASMTAVKTARSTVDRGSDSQDFDGAFEEFVK